MKNDKALEGAGNIEPSVTEPEPKEKRKLDEEEPEVKEKNIEKMTKSELLKKVEEAQEEAKKSHDLYLRAQAETENIKKRSKKIKSRSFSFYTFIR